MKEKAVVMDGDAIRRTLVRITHEIIESHQKLDNLVIVCIPSGGTPLGQLIQQNIREFEKIDVPLMEISIDAYRDDFKAESLRLSGLDSICLEQKDVILVDDVLSTGRTVRAGLDAMKIHGRPRKVALAVLIDRGHRELPIRADFVGKNMPTSHKENVLVKIKEPLEFSRVIITERSEAHEITD